ncbi:Retrotrans gag domain-containing protein [Abeliophyllum distichum]|uniref:Retrotrans gag domain-containing protein n=1 Tax=Abeliophyllum distichum TaxID=126358 RepID=A0ABD1V3H0_9LAMI
MRTKTGIPEYNLSIAPTELIMVLKRICNAVNWLSKMKSSSDQRDKSKWCEFCVDHGHRIDDCIVLRLEVAKLLKQKHLSDLLTEKCKENLARRTQQSCGKQDSTPTPKPTHDRTVNSITGRSEVSGITRTTTQRHTRQASHPTQNANQVNNLDSPQIISSTTSEATELLNPNHDALVISLNIANCLIKCIMIENCSSANILFLETVKAMDIPEENIT